MAADDARLTDRIEKLERRVAALEQRSIPREALDEEIHSLEHRLTELREIEEG
ncbi:MAG TPA: hypothetical protein VMU76_12785 [Acidimicrobiales bacterium]|nr:hypothetical protein [Acidimicrobiales bacterium]